jgi:hypothetical protein
MSRELRRRRLMVLIGVLLLDKVLRVVDLAVADGLNVQTQPVQTSHDKTLRS